METNLVIIPTYNEKENVELIVRAIDGLSTGFSILIVDDNSPDKTAEIVGRLQAEFPFLHLLSRQEKQGLGKAYLAGFDWALQRDFSFIFQMDADFSHNPSDLERLLEVSKNSGAVSIGSRYLNGTSIVNWPLFRLFLSFGASKYVQWITGMKIKDPTAGFVCYPREALLAIELDKVQFKGYAFQIEMKFRSFVKGIPLKEIPIIFVDRTRGKSKMNSSIIGEAIWGVIKLKYQQITRVL
ncbi:MAG: dolichyl-phosphate beta-D-mannosyltransferase [Flavobacteriaceae bacterium]|nr:MAG: dolichyl-phosphate beta-D-mannosyltransferase [Flavobacteriaceae bacterium]